MVFQTGLFFLCWKGRYRENQGILLIYPSVHSGDWDRDHDFEKSKCNCKQTVFEGSCSHLAQLCDKFVSNMDIL